MNSAPFMKTKNDVFAILKTLLVLLIPLVMYGIYKNGIIPLVKSNGDIWQLLKTIFMPLMGFGIGFIINTVNKRFNLQKNSYLVLYGLLAGMLVPITINFLVFVLILSIGLSSFNWFLSRFSFNKNALLQILFLLMIGSKGISGLQNSYESSVETVYSIFDLIIGRNVSGIATSSIMLVVFSYIFLAFKCNYKKDIPLYILGSTLILFGISAIINGDVNYFVSHYFNAYLFFAAVFVATDTFSSPYTSYGRTLYGLSIGLLIYCLSFLVNLNLSIFIAIFLISFFKKIFDKLSRVSFILKLFKHNGSK